MDQQGQGPKWPKREDRRPVRATGTLYLPDGSAVSVRLTDISFDGCQVETDVILPIGHKVKLALPRLGDINAQVRWALPGRAGMRFLLEEPAAGDRQNRRSG